MSNNTLSPDREKSIELLTNNYYDKMSIHVDFGSPENAECICNEYIVDGIDPEDGGYEWLFLNDLTQLEEQITVLEYDFKLLNLVPLTNNQKAESILENNSYLVEAFEECVNGNEILALLDELFDDNVLIG